MQKKAIVVGAGIAGLACSLRLQKKGYGVTVVERNNYTGGKMHVLEGNGFRFDLGPSLFTMPGLVESLFELSDKPIEDYFTYKKKEVICHYFWPDGSFFKASAEPEEWIKEAADFFGEPSEILRRYLNNSARKYSLTAPIFLERSLADWKTYLSTNTLKAIFNLGALNIFNTLDKHHKGIFKNKKLIQYFNRFATYNGSSPYKTSAIMSMIPHLEMHKGTYFPTEGMHSIGQSLYQLAKDKGVHFLLETPVVKINVENNSAKGIEIVVNGATQYLKADVVVSNADVFHTYEKLLPNIQTPKRIVQEERSSSGLIFYWGISTSFPSLDLHNIFFSEDYELEFKEIFDQQTLPTDPTIYLNISSKEKPSDAPKGCENWFVMVNAPANKGQDWEDLKQKMKQTIVSKLSDLLGVNVADYIVYEEILDPIGIEKNTNASQGALYGTSSNDSKAAFLRQSNKSHIENLYFCGGSAHPGGGIPLCLYSAKITADLIPEI
ncbi:MAG: phytoene desaturase [Flavobacteriaceae bacterium]|nr:phytoene desaturase [Flavobacteriaceae bacterium]